MVSTGPKSQSAGPGLGFDSPRLHQNRLTAGWEEQKMGKHRFFLGDVRECLRQIPEKSVQCVVTSPPYWGLRDYGVEGQLGLEETPQVR